MYNNQIVMFKNSFLSPLPPPRQTKTAFFIIIICVAAFLRLFDLEHHPAGLHSDEASFLANSQILKATGKDEDGRPHPFFLKSLIDPKPALYSYLQIPFISLFPHHQTAASRIPGALFGIGSLIFSYFIIKKLTHNQKLALIFMALLSLSPWHINVSRSTQEVIMSFFFTTWNLFLFFNLINIEEKKYFSKRNKVFSLSIFFLTSLLAMYSYHSAKVFLPSFIIGYLFFNFRQIKQKSIFWLILVITLSSFFLITFFSNTLTRFNTIGFLANPQIGIDVTYQSMAATGHLPFILIRLLYNKVTAQILFFLQNYFSYFTGEFLFFFHQLPQRYAIPFQGLMLFCEIPLLLYGVFITLKKKVVWPFIWLLFAPLAGALTYQEIPSLIRNFALIIPLLFFVASAFEKIFSIKKFSHLFHTTVVGLYFLNWLYFFNQYWFLQPNYQPWYRNTTDQQLAQVLKNNYFDKQISIYSSFYDIYLYLIVNDNVSIKEQVLTANQRKLSLFQLGKYTLYRDTCTLKEFDLNKIYVFDVTCYDSLKHTPFFPYFKLVPNGLITYKDLSERYFILEIPPALFPALMEEVNQNLIN